MSESKLPNFEELLKWARSNDPQGRKTDITILYWTAAIIVVTVTLWYFKFHRSPVSALDDLPGEPRAVARQATE